MFTKRSSRNIALFLAFALAASLAIALGALTTTAHASKVTDGKLARFDRYESNTGLLVVRTKDGNKKFRVGQKTHCEYATENYGDSIPCRHLGRSIYKGQHVSVHWVRRDNKRWASLVHVDL